MIETTHKKQVVGCSCSMCRHGMHGRHRSKNASRYEPQAMAVRRIRRAWKQLGRFVVRLSRGYTD